MKNLFFKSYQPQTEVVNRASGAYTRRKADRRKPMTVKRAVKSIVDGVLDMNWDRKLELWEKRVIVLGTMLLLFLIAVIDFNADDARLEQERMKQMYIEPKTRVQFYPYELESLFNPEKTLVTMAFASEIQGNGNISLVGEGERTVIAEGKVSYYSTDGCLGCDENQIMANGEKFDENDLILAVPAEWIAPRKMKLNSSRCPECGFVAVTNLDNGKVVYGARITDTGGFAKYGRIADLSKALMEQLDAKTGKRLPDGTMIGSTIRIESLPTLSQ